MTTAATPTPAPVPATVVERLRTSTRAWHDALESTPFATAMIAGTLPLERYVGQLAAYRVILEALEGELSRATHPSAVRVWSPELVKLPLVERDLGYFADAGGLPQAAGPWAVEEAEAFARDIRRQAAKSDFQALFGYLYVMEGSTLGALVLRPYVTAGYHLTDGHGTAYYAGGDRDRWARFTARMNQAFTEPEAQDAVVAAARHAYRHAAAITSALSEGLAPAPS